MGDGGRCDGAGVSSTRGAELVERVTMRRYDRIAARRPRCPSLSPELVAHR
jgi:hypothetical protein